MLAEATTSTPARLVLEGAIAGATPAEVTAHFTEPDLVTTWWSEVAEVDEDGAFAYRWPSHGWTLRGRFLDDEPGRRIRFTWSWDHEPLMASRTVLVTTAPVEDGTHITITHGDYGPDDVAERRSHLEGWQHFAKRLATRFE